MLYVKTQTLPFELRNAHISSLTTKVLRPMIEANRSENQPLTKAYNCSRKHRSRQAQKHKKQESLTHEHKVNHNYNQNDVTGSKVYIEVKFTHNLLNIRHMKHFN